MNLNLSVRKIVAIALIVLSVVLLFWPTVAGLSAMGMGDMYSVSEFRTNMTKDIGNYFEAAQLYGFQATLLGILGILLNVCFFGMIAAAVLAIVMILMNKSNIAAIIMMILAILAVIICVVITIVTKEMTGYGSILSFAPGVAMFLLPIFTIAAVILSKKEA